MFNEEITKAKGCTVLIYSRFGGRYNGCIGKVIGQGINSDLPYRVKLLDGPAQGKIDSFGSDELMLVSSGKGCCK